MLQTFHLHFLISYKDFYKKIIYLNFFILYFVFIYNYYLILQIFSLKISQFLKVPKHNVTEIMYSTQTNYKLLLTVKNTNKDNYKAMKFN